MAQIQLFTDLTGQMNQDQIHQSNISNIISELNRNSDQLDALNNVLSVIAYGTLTYNWNGTDVGHTLVTPFNTTGASYTSFVYMSRNTDNPTQYFPLPYNQIINNSNGDSVMSKLFYTATDTSVGQVTISLNFYATASPINYTFYYIVVQQPTVVTS